MPSRHRSCLQKVSKMVLAGSLHVGSIGRHVGVQGQVLGHASGTRQLAGEGFQESRSQPAPRPGIALEQEVFLCC